jgi:CheY-like chemotaxis protein
MSFEVFEKNQAVNILLVDDDDGDARAVERAFKAADIVNPLVRAVDGVDALDILRGENGKPRLPSPYLLLVDINMPRMSGIDLLKELRDDETLRYSVVFMLTTSNRQDDKLAAYGSNVAGYIVKQHAGEDFQNLIRLMEGYWRVVELP